MRPIKFRGVEFFSKRHVYGQTIRETEDGFDIWSGDDWTHCTDLAQLVGYDRDGREVYEGDVIVDDIAEYVAHLFANVRISDCKLKEA